MATATDKEKLQRLKDAQAEHGKLTSKLGAYATGALNAVPFLNQSGISYPGPKEHAARSAQLKRDIANEEEAISTGKRDYRYEDESKLPKGLTPKMANGGKVGSASKRADGIATKGKTRGTMIMCGGGKVKK